MSKTKQKTTQKKMPRPWCREDSGVWYVQFGGKQVSLGRDREAAFQQYHELMADQQAIQPGMFVVHLLDDYLAWCQRNRAKATYAWYQHFLSSFAKTLKKKMPITALKPLHVTQWIDKSFADSSASTRRAAITAVQRAFTWATRQGHIRRSPIYGIEKPEAGRREVVLTEEQFAAMLAQARDDHFRDLLTILWETGCRPQEVVRVQASFFEPELRRWVFPVKDSKGKKIHRVVYLNDKAMEITKRLCKQSPEGPILRNRKGRPWNKNSVRCRFRRIKVGVEGLCAYNLRHTFCNRALTSGVDSVTVGLLMGHVDLSQVARTYAHLSKNPEFLQEQLAKVK